MATVRALIRLDVDNGQGKVSIAQSLDSTEAWVETRDMDLSLPQAKKFVQRVYSRLTAKPGLTRMYLRIYGRNQLHEPLTLVKEVLLTNMDEPVKLINKQYRYWRFRWHDEEVKVDWTLYGFKVLGDIGALRE